MSACTGFWSTKPRAELMTRAPETPVRILLVEDTPSDAELACREIQKTVPDCQFRRVETRDQFLEALESFEPDLIVSDYSMPRFDGLAALRLTIQHAPQTPLIILTGSLNEDTAVECMRAGASNYVIKEQIKRLGQSVLHALEEGRLRKARLEAEQALRRSEERFRSLIENAQDLIIVLDAQGIILFQSPSVRRGLGLTGPPAVRPCVFEWVHPEDAPQARSLLSRAFAEPDRAVTAEYRVRHADGSWRLLESIGKCLVGDQPPAVVVNSREITARRQLEAQLRQAQKMEAIGQLAGGVAHDFNNILTVILGNAELLRQTEDLPADDTPLVHQIIEGAERAAGLTRQLLLFSRKQTMREVCLDLNEVVGNMTRMLQRILGEDVALRAEYAPDIPAILGDVGMIEQVLMNLAVNARDAMPAGGRLAIRTALRPPSEAPAGVPEALAGPQVCLSVTDTGTGIAPEHLPHIFEPFFTTKDPGKGTGLGLATVYAIVKQHRGVISVSSDPGQGTTFSICLPGAPAGLSQQKRLPAGASALPSGSEVILAVEDEPALGRLVNNVLQSCGYTVLLADSGPAALEVWRARRLDIQLLLTDMIMPDGLTGRQLAARLREDRPSLKVIYTSGYSPELVGRGALLEPGVFFLQKPYAPVQLAQMVRDCLNGKAPPA